MKAPIPELLWYLAVFRRTFVLMERSAAAGDREGMWLSQWAAEVLHNVPAMLRDYDAQGFNTPQQREAQLIRFPELILHWHAPDETRTAAARLVTRARVTTELGLADDLHDLDLAPGDALDRGLEQLYNLCLDMRQRMPRQALAEEGWAVTEFYGRNNAILAGVTKELPWGLVHWAQFDSARFEDELTEAYGRLERWSESTQ